LVVGKVRRVPSVGALEVALVGALEAASAGTWEVALVAVEVVLEDKMDYMAAPLLVATPVYEKKE